MKNPLNNQFYSLSYTSVKQKKQQKGRIKQKLDRILKKDFQILQQRQSKKYNSLELINNNDLILEYVQSVYQQYKIINPLPVQRKYFKRSINQEKKTTKKTKIILSSSKTDKKFKTPQQQKQSEDYIQQDEKIEEQDGYLNKNLLNNTFIKVGLNYFDQNNTKYPQQFKNANQKCRPIISPFDLSSNVFKREQKRYIPEQFRYCIGCNDAILHNNIQFHELSCKDYKHIKQMNIQEILQVLSEKINQCENKITQLFEIITSEDAERLQQLSKSIINKSKQIIKQGQFTSQYTDQYDKIVSIAKKWCFLTEEINRVNWFLKIREKIKIQLHI